MITNEELKSLMIAMKSRYGLDFTNYEKNSLKRGLTRLMMKHKMSSMLELWGRVLRDKEFFNEGIDDLLVNLTELFRNPEAWISIRDNVLGQFQDSRYFSIWHAGCSTGEEVYTMGIVLEEMNLLKKNRTLATDLSEFALQRAISGQYPLVVLEQYLTPFLKFYPNRKLKDYFDFKDDHAKIQQRFQNHVTFEKHNLVHDQMERKHDIIFCRNVMIYFDDILKNRVLHLFYNSLKSGGYLIIGYYDIMPDVGKELFEVYDIKTRIYKKRK